jgi:hypothetical protein
MPELVSLNRQIAAVEKGGPGGRPVEAPAMPPAAGLPVPAEFPGTPLLERGVNVERGQQAIREDYAIRRLARPALEEDAYQQELERLRQRFVELRREPPIDRPDDGLQQATVDAAKLRQLEDRLAALRERPDDRLFYSPEQLRGRREQFRRLQADLETLRGEQLERLRQLLSPPRRPAPAQKEGEGEVPPALLAQAEKTRDERRKQALETLHDLERRDLTQLSETVLPAPPETAPISIPAYDPAAAPNTLTQAVRSAREKAGALPGAGNPSGSALPGLRRRLRELRQAMIQDLQAAALAAGKARGIMITFKRGRVPDRTRELRPAVGKVLRGPGTR